MGEPPQGQNENCAESQYGQALEIDISAGDDEASVHEHRQIVLEPHPAEVAEQFQDSQTDTKGGDHLGQGLPPHAQQDKTVDQGPEHHIGRHCKQYSHQVGNVQEVQHAPDAVGCQDVKGPVGKIGHTADAESQVKADGH